MIVCEKDHDPPSRHPLFCETGEEKKSITGDHDQEANSQRERDYKFRIPEERDRDWIEHSTQVQDEVRPGCR